MEKQRAQMWEQSNELINNKRDKPAFFFLRQQKWKLHQDVEVLLLTNDSLKDMRGLFYSIYWKKW